ncbi:hypothetical protein [Okeania sp. SIO2C2]|nr:hypothetical protein [Okeania sp. SIO2C2]
MNFIKLGRVAKSLTGAIAAYISFFSIVIVTPTLAINSHRRITTW